MNIIKRLVLAVLLVVSLVHVQAEETETVHIRTAEEFKTFAEKSSYDAYTRGKTFVLDQDISLQDMSVYVPVFCGTFDGQGHTISGLVLRESLSPAGLFGIVGKDATITGLSVSAEIAPQGEQMGIGGLAGVNYGLIENSSFMGSVEGKRDTGGIAGINATSGRIVNCTVSGVLYGQAMTGGIAGYNSGVLQGCFNSALINTDAEDGELTVNDLSLSHSLDVRSELDESGTIVRTDFGGIAGYNSGSILSSRNEGTIGYPQIGYNVGGIAGRNSGQITLCKNIAQIYGRKDVGGIVGQAEPYVETELSASAVAQLSAQVNSLDGIVNSAKVHADEADTQLQNRLDDLSEYVDAANDSLNTLEKNPEEIEGEVESAWASIDMQNASEVLNASVSSLYSRADSLLEDVQDKGEQLANDARAIQNQINSISSTLSDALYTAQHPSQLVQDTSALDPEAVLFGKVSVCTNTGSINGTLNVGGIAGSMALEYAVDPEDDVSSLPDASTKAEYELKCILLKNVNEGAVQSVRNNIGGIAGRMDLGLVLSCENYGDVSSSSGSDVGGIAGVTAGVVRKNSVKCTLSGKEQVGGIVGDGTEGTASGTSSTVDNNVSMVVIEDCEEGSGAISGTDHGEFSENVFVSDTLAGLNGVSYEGRAYPISYEELLQRPGLPSAFEKFTLKFVADGQVLKTVDFKYGDSFGEEVYPAVPSKDGQYARFDVQDLSNLHFDTTVHVEYVQSLTALSSVETRGSGRTVFYLKGTFDEDDSFTAVPTAHESEEFRFVRQSFWPAIGDYLRHPGEGLAYDFLEQWTLTIPDDGSEVHEVRYLLPSNLAGSYQIYENHDGQWNRVHSEQNGSYAVFQVPSNQVRIALITVIPGWWIYALCAGIALIVVLIVLRVRNREKRKATRAAIRGRIAVNKRLQIGLVCLAVFNLLVLFAGVHFLRSGVANSAHAYQLVKEYAACNPLAMEIDLSTSLGTEKTKETLLLQKGEGNIAGIKRDDLTLYYSDGNIYLENGRSCRVSELAPDYGSLLDLAAAIYENGTITTDTEDGKTVYRLVAQQEEAQTLLEVLMAQYAEDLPDVKSIELAVYEANGKLDHITLKSAGVLKDENNTAYTVAADLIAEDATKYDLTIPDAVLTAVKNHTESDLVLTSDELDLLSAWAQLNHSDSTMAQIHLLADTDLLHIDDTLVYRSNYNDGDPIRSVQKNDLMVYFNDEKMCDADGKLSMNTQASALVQTGRLPETVYDICMMGRFNVSSAGSSKVYTIELDQETINTLKEDLLKSVQMDGVLEFDSGTIQVTMSKNQISRITVNLKGKATVLEKEIPVTLGADATISNSVEFQVPDKVKTTLKED